ncbi:polysaccharide pyruvyl transferase family protein [Pseudomonas sp. D2-3]
MLGKNRGKRYLYTGYYGFGNFGDDLFPIACDISTRKCRGSSAIILSPPISGVSAHFLVPGFLASYYNKTNKVGRFLRLIFLLYGALRFRNVVLAGGSTISSGSSMFMRRVQYFLGVSGVVKLYAIGVSVGPFEEGKDHDFARNFIDSLEFLSVRDAKSRKECETLGVRVVPDVCNDLAGALPVENFVAGPVREKAKPILGVSMCRYESIVGGNVSQESERNISIKTGILEFAKKHDCRVHILVLNSDCDLGDFSISRDMEFFLKTSGVECVLIDYHGPMDMIKHIYTCDFLFSIRLHGAICAYLLNIPFVLLEYHRKCTDFLDYIGKGADLRLTSSTSSSEAVYAAIESMFIHGDKFTESPKDYREKSKQNFKFLDCVKYEII